MDDSAFHDYAFSTTPAGVVKSYRDGVEIYTEDWGCTVSTMYATHTVKWFGAGTCTEKYLNAVIEDIGIFPQVLTAAQTGDMTAIWGSASHYFVFRY